MKMGPREQAFHTDRLVAAGRTGRWSWKRKESLLALVQARLLTPNQATERYGFSPEELAAMRDRYARSGPAGLRTTQLQEHR